ncbi:MAG TPA: hypothetical protein VMU18_11070 [Rhodoblastus sp.]|nr:hypothetical protein [Rhodoblastus sp.]
MARNSRKNVSGAHGAPNDAPSPALEVDKDFFWSAQAARQDDFRYDLDDKAVDEANDEAALAGSLEETALYISDMIGSLALLAREAKLDLLTYLLDMARVEAEMQARQAETPFEND